MWNLGDSQTRTTAREDYDRVQSRVLDALHFKLQQAINLKDDEIARLEDEITYLKGQLEASEMQMPKGSIQTSETILNLKRKIFKAQQKSAMLISQTKTKFAQDMKELAASHQEHVKALRQQIEMQLLGDVNPTKIKKQDEVDEFLESLNDTKYRIRSRVKTTETALPVMNSSFVEFQKEEGKLNEAKQKVRDLQNQVDSVKAEIALLERENKPAQPSYKPAKKGSERNKNRKSDSITESDYSLSPAEKESTTSEISYDSNASEYEDDIEDSVDDALQAELEKQKKDFEDQMAQIKKQHEKEVKKLKDQIAEHQNFITTAAKLDEQNETSSAAKAHKSRLDRTKKLSEELSRMSAKQKETKRKQLILENKTLKREIGRLDFMVYGKSGKYNKWRLLK